MAGQVNVVAANVRSDPRAIFAAGAKGQPTAEVDVIGVRRIAIVVEEIEEVVHSYGKPVAISGDVVPDIVQVHQRGGFHDFTRRCYYGKRSEFTIGVEEARPVITHHHKVPVVQGFRSAARPGHLRLGYGSIGEIDMVAIEGIEGLVQRSLLQGYRVQ